MSRADVDDFLAELDDVVDDWEGSLDSATWAADGSHEPAELDGDYYALDSPGSIGRRIDLGSWRFAGHELRHPRALRAGEMGPWWSPPALTGDDEIPEAVFRALWAALAPVPDRTALALRDMATSAARAMQGISALTAVLVDETSRWRNAPGAPETLVPRQRFLPRDVFLLGLDRVTPRPDPWAQTLPDWRTLGVRLLDPPPFRVAKAEGAHLPSPPTAGPPPTALGQPRRHGSRGAAQHTLR